MTALAQALPVAEPYTATRFDAFRVANVSAGKEPKWRTYAVDLGGYLIRTVAEARDAALIGQAFAHKDQLIIRETGDSVRLHVFAIKRRSAPVYTYRDHRKVRLQPLYADPLSVIDGGVLFQFPQGAEAGTETASVVTR